MRLLITGGSGYIGGLLVERFVKRLDVEKILVIDKEPLLFRDPKIEFIQTNLADIDWQDKAAIFGPHVVIHTAWQIREMYAKQDIQHEWNIEGSNSIFDFCMGWPAVRKLIYFSTIASYGAYPDNSLDHFFTEDEPFRKTDFLYAEEKRITEENLKQKYEQAKKEGRDVPQVLIIRPASITGPRAKKVKKGINLQSVISGKFMPFLPVTPKWLRQFVHENDIAAITELLSFKDIQGDYEVYNACPPNSVVRGYDMAKSVGKKPLLVKPWMVRVAFFFAWHLSLGKIPTSKGGWKSYSYPIPVDGSKIAKKLGYEYNSAHINTV